MQRKADLYPVREIFLEWALPFISVFCKRNKVSLKRGYIDTAELEELYDLSRL